MNDEDVAAAVLTQVIPLGDVATPQQTELGAAVARQIAARPATPNVDTVSVTVSVDADDVPELIRALAPFAPRTMTIDPNGGDP